MSPVKTWLEPLPDALLGSDRNDPAAVVASRGSLRLAFIAAMQVLPARQRAILIMRDVLDMPAAEVADELGMTPTAVNSALQRARAKLDQVGVVEDQVDDHTDPWALVDRYVTAFQNADIAALKRLLAKDVILEMPPFMNWFVGREGYGRFIARVFATRGTDWRMIPTAANGQPGMGAYRRGKDGAYHVHTLQVFTVCGSVITRTTVFQDEMVFAMFGLAPTL